MDNITIIKNNKINKYNFGKGLILEIFFDGMNGAKNFSMGTVIIEPGHETVMHSRDVEEVIYMIRGSGEVITENGGKYILESGDSILIPSGISHKHVNSSDKQLKQLWIFAPQGAEKGLRDLPIRGEM